MTSRRSSSVIRGMSSDKQLPPSSSETAPSPSSDEPDWWADRYSIVLLIALYAAQGLPMGLAFGSIPFLLKEGGSSYADLAQFSFASLPYSLKLFIAPVVDSFYSARFGRRKSWIVPVQIIIGFCTFFLANVIHSWVVIGRVQALMPTFLLIITLTATQDIAVDGWSLTMLRKANVSYASTCQSLGLSIGYFATFTVFLAFSNDAFCDNYVRPFLFLSSNKGAVVDLYSALRFMGLYYILLTAYITFFKQEHIDSGEAKKNDAEDAEQAPMIDDDETSNSGTSDVQPTRSKMLARIAATYRDLLTTIRLPAVQRLVLALLVAKVGFSAYDNVATLKLLEFGFSKESMASMAVLQTPFLLIGTVLTGKWAAKRSPIDVYLFGFVCRFLISLSGPPTVALLVRRGGVVTPSYYLLILIISVLYSLASECLMFVGIGAFFLNITSSSVHVAGSYLTLLNTSSNMGGTWHKAIVLWLVDRVTIRENCVLPPDASFGTLCPIKYDGFYILSFALIPVAVTVGLHLFRSLPRLGRLPESEWTASR